MLRSFRLGNHRSFLTEQELLLMPRFDKSRYVLPVTAVYGANASGKSNLLSGLAFMQSAVRSSFQRWDALEGVPRTPFKLASAAAGTPSVFVVEFKTGGVAYTYGFAMDDERIGEEWLYSYPEKRKRIVFERTGSEVKFGSTLRDAKGELGVLGQMTRGNALLLSVAVQLNLEFAMPAYRFITRDLIFSSSEGLSNPRTEALGRFIVRDPNNQRRVVDLLRAADLGITDLLVEEDEDPMWSRSVERAEAELQKIDAKMADDVDEEYRNSVRDRLNFLRDSGPRKIHRVKTVHGDLAAPFDVAEESQGTRSWLRLIPIALGALDRGSVLLVDEIDSSLHPLLTARLVGLFRDERTNPNGAQLIFTTHDTSLLGTMLGDEVLKRDEVWFVSKEERGDTSLYALSDFKPRKEENAERRYLQGSYGAVPFVDHDEFVMAVRGERD
ncbi:AAA family ATPase [Saccharopolyspora indica]|uniref:AAA family ATPase n=1 Tax=Saccharopolyspora indica TaxID=1229659 RepID=UPI0022EA1F18|nr:ATP-binding protein [Saccharopolyspora indica]MDA3643675.1 AAA family ATPase [Saccharopolyspora indica]